MKTMQKISADEAIAALEAQAWTEPIPGENYERAVEAALSLTRDTDGNDLPGEAEIPLGEIRHVIAEALGEPKRTVHCYLGGFGADWDLASAVELVRRADSIAWVDSIMLGHELAAEAQGKVYRFQATRPVPGTDEED